MGKKNALAAKIAWSQTTECRVNGITLDTGGPIAAKQVRLWRMVQHDETEVVPLDGSHALAVGALLARTGTSDIADAHVVICSQRSGRSVITSDPLDLRRLDPKLRVISV